MSGWSVAQAQERFARLDQWLVDNAYLWRPAPFTCLTLPWEQQHPELAHWLRGRSLQQAEQQHLIPWLLQAPEPFPALAQQALELSAVSRIKPQTLDFDPRLAVGVPGRKLQQIHAFTQSLPVQDGAGAWLDWCGGKGYLARHLAAGQHEVHCLEWQEQLCRDGQQECRKHGASVHFHQLDAFSVAAEELLQQTDNWVALHACGDLHTHLLRQVTHAAPQQLALSPCCYNKIQGDVYRPLSKAGQASRLGLRRADLGLALQATVTAGARGKRLRDQSMAWRLAFDLMQREERGVDAYLPVSSSASKWLQLEFPAWCFKVAELKHIQLPASIDWQQAEVAGWLRLAQVRNLELVQALFRRPLELWLLLDQLVFLQEQGYEVQLGEFCPQQLTPRNLLLLARRKAVFNALQATANSYNTSPLPV